jgi:hypothetical protein
MPICGFGGSVLGHAGLSRVETEAATVEEDGGLDVLSVSEATDSSFVGHDFAVRNLPYCVGDLASAAAQEILQTCRDRCRGGSYGLQICMNHLLAPVFEYAVLLGFSWLIFTGV